MSGTDRVRTCYQSATLKFVIDSSLANQSLREWFGLPATDTSKVSNVIREASDQELLKPVDAQATSQRYARRLRFPSATLRPLGDLCLATMLGCVSGTRVGNCFPN